MNFSDWYETLKIQNPDLYKELLKLQLTNNANRDIHKSNGKLSPLYKKLNEDGTRVLTAEQYKTYQKHYQKKYRNLRKEMYRCEICDKGFVYDYILENHCNKPKHIRNEIILLFKELPYNIVN